MEKTATPLKIVYCAKWCATHHLKMFAKIFMNVNAVLFNCYIEYRATIPRSTEISHHGSGVVINGAAVIGNNVSIAHGVTIGNRMPDHPGAPIIGDNVYIGCNSYVGGGITIGSNVKIGAHTVVIKDVPENCTVVGNPMRIIETSKET